MSTTDEPRRPSNRPPNLVLRRALEAAVQRDPSMTLAALAAECGCHLTRASQLLREMGYRRVREWRLSGGNGRN